MWYVGQISPPANPVVHSSTVINIYFATFLALLFESIYHLFLLSEWLLWFWILIACVIWFLFPLASLPFPRCQCISRRRHSALSLVFTKLLVKPRTWGTCGTCTHTMYTDNHWGAFGRGSSGWAMMDSASVIEVTGSADSAYYSHQSFESDLSCDLSETNTERPEALQEEQGEEFILTW